jgi:nitrite reductase (NO-forming)
MHAGAAPLATTGGALYLTGLAGVAVAAFAPLRTSLRSGWSHIVAAYGAALALVGVGAAIATLFVAGVPAVVAAWAVLKPAHAWLNAFGFVSLVIAATLVHLGPTIAGGRIRPRRTADVALLALAVGPMLVASGYICGVDPAVRMGGAIQIGGAVALAALIVAVRRDAGRWTTDLDWHRLTSWSLVAGVGWFVLVAVVAGGRLVLLGATPAAWSLELIAAPLVPGWIVQVLVGAWTHLLPAIAPGTPTGHAALRRLLARGATPRLVAWNLGVAALAVGVPLRLDVAILVGGTLTLVTMLGTLGLLLIPATRSAQRHRAGASTCSSRCSSRSSR